MGESWVMILITWYSAYNSLHCITLQLMLNLLAAESTPWFQYITDRQPSTWQRRQANTAE